MASIFDFILNLPPWLVLTLVFLFPALEASAFVGVVIPGEIGVVLGGVVANQGGLPLWAVLVAAISGAVIGDSIGFEVGRRWGAQLMLKLPDRLMDHKKLDRAKETIRQYGGRSIFIGRFTAALRAVVPSAAGMSGMKYLTFLTWNFLGGALWATGFVLLGYLAGSQYKRVEHDASYIGMGLLVAIACFAGYKYYRHRKGSDSETTDAAHASRGAASDSREVKGK